MPSTGTISKATPRARAASRTLGCSTDDTMRRSTGEPRMARLLASVPPEVKTIIVGSTPRQRARLSRAFSTTARAARPSRCIDEALPSDQGGEHGLLRRGPERTRGIVIEIGAHGSQTIARTGWTVGPANRRLKGEVAPVDHIAERDRRKKAVISGGREPTTDRGSGIAVPQRSRRWRRPDSGSLAAARRRRK